MKRIFASIVYWAIRITWLVVITTLITMAVGAWLWTGYTCISEHGFMPLIQVALGIGGFFAALVIIGSIYFWAEDNKRK